MYLTDKQLAERFAVSRQTVWRRVKSQPGFPTPRSLSPGCTRWNLAEIEAWETGCDQTDRAA